MRRPGRHLRRSQEQKGVVEFASRRDMERAIDKFDDYDLNGRRIKMRAKRRKAAEGRQGPGPEAGLGTSLRFQDLGPGPGSRRRTPSPGWVQGSKRSKRDSSPRSRSCIDTKPRKGSKSRSRSKSKRKDSPSPAPAQDPEEELSLGPGLDSTKRKDFPSPGQGLDPSQGNPAGLIQIQGQEQVKV